MPDHDHPANLPGHRAVLLDDHRIAEALAGVYRAISACQFYPPQHPTLAQAVDAGYQAWRRAAEDYRWEQPGLQLRSSGLWFGETRLGADNPAVASLARTLAGHGVISLRRTGALSRQGFEWLVATLATAPDVVASHGGFASAWSREPFADALAVESLTLAVGEGSGRAGAARRPRPRREQWGEGVQASAEDLAGTDGFLLGRLRSLQQRSPRERALVDQLLSLGRIADLQEFLAALREIAGAIDAYLDADRPREAFYAVLFLYREARNMDALKEAAKRDYLLDTVRLVVKGEFLTWVVQRVATAQGDEEAEAGELVLRTLGRTAAVPVINALCAEHSRSSRRRLVNVLVSIGEPAVPWAIKMLDDQRWFVVRNMVTVLGGVGSTEAVRALLRLVGDPDPRIRREVARALGRSGVPQGEDALLGLLGDRDAGVRTAAVQACAAYPGERVLDAVWRVFQRTPIRGAEWELKLVVLQTVARLGLEAAERRLLRELGRRHWLRRDRWDKVRAGAALALGRVGGPAAAPALQRAAQGGATEVKTAAARALAALERRGAAGEAS